ncbi:MAG TPA: hypothetical protein VH814_09695 [Steroidobacteraceae bacterium]|jgi:hypothetical protein
MPELLSRLDYRLVGSPTAYSTSKALEAALDESTDLRDVIRKAAYESNGWTYLFDPEMVVMMSEGQLSDFARQNSTDIFAWVCEGVSASYGFRIFSPELRRDVLAVGGSVETDVGPRLAEEQNMDWAEANETDILALAMRFGAPYDYFAEDRNYAVYTLDESGVPAPDTTNAKSTEPPFRPEDIDTKVVGRIAVESADRDDSTPESPALPRWVQVIAGLLLLPFTLLCTAGALTIFGVPKVQSDPLLQLVAGVISLLCLWAVSIAVRLILGLKGKGLFGPLTLRIIAATAIGLVIGGLFTGIWVSHPFRSAALSICYVLIALRLWKIAAYRARGAA